MRLGKVRWLSLGYAAIFAVLSFLSVWNNVTNDYHLAFVALSVVAYSAMSFGNFVYALGLDAPGLRRPWRMLAPSFVLYFVVAGLIDGKYGKHAGPGDDLATEVLTWGVGLLVFAPMFWCNFRLAHAPAPKTPQ